LVWAVNIGDQGTAPVQEEDDFQPLVCRGVGFAMDGMWGDVEEIPSTDGDGILFVSCILEMGGPGDDVAIDFIVSVMMPTGDGVWLSSRAQDQVIFVFKGPMSDNAGGGGGLSERLGGQCF